MLLALSSCEHGALAPRAPFLSAGSGGGEKKVEEAAPAAEKARAPFRRILQRTVHTPERHTSAGAREAGMEFSQVVFNTSGPIDRGAAAELLFKRGFFNKGYGAETPLTVLQIDHGKELSREGLLEHAKLLIDCGFALRHVPDEDHPGQYVIAVSKLSGAEIYPSGAPASWNCVKPRSSQANVKFRESDPDGPTKAATFDPEYFGDVLLKEQCRFGKRLAAAVILAQNGGHIALGEPIDGNHNGEIRLADGGALSRYCTLRRPSIGARQPKKPSRCKTDRPAALACSH